MSSMLITIILWAAAIGSGLMAGIYFTFSVFVMRAFNKIDAPHAVTAMNAINQTILNSLFMPLFFVTSIISLFLIIFSFSHWNESGSHFIFYAGTIYLIGMFFCTIIFNVPLNNSLAELNLDKANVNMAWSHYYKHWTNWNHLRTMSSLITSLLCIWVLSHEAS